MLRWQKLWDRGSLTAIWSPSWAMGRTRTAPAWTGAPAILGSGYCWSVAIVSLKTSTRNGCCCKSRAARRNWASICRGCSAIPPSPTWNGPAAGKQSAWRQSLGLADQGWRNRLAAGLTWTGASKLSLTLEGQHDGAAPERDDWRALRANPPAYGVSRRGRRGGLLTRRAALLRAHWQDALLDDLDLTAMRSFDLVDHSGMNWAEARYHLGPVDLALQWQRFDGAPDSHYGASPARQVWQLVFNYFY